MICPFMSKPVRIKTDQGSCTQKHEYELMPIQCAKEECACWIKSFQSGNQKDYSHCGLIRS